MYDNGYPYGQYPYGGQAPDPAELYSAQQRLKEKRLVRRLSWGSAAATAGFYALANMLYGVYMVFTRRTPLAAGATEQELVFDLSVDLFITFISMALPFAAVYMVFRKRFNTRPIPIGASKMSAPDTVLTVFAGLGLLIMGSYVAEWFTVGLEDLTGATFEYTDIQIPTSALGMTLYVIRMTIFPAVMEELALRGVLMGSLRRYGDLFAIVTSGLVFALMHGNMVQAPFAFIASFALGYAVIKTGTIWTSIAIHCLNNSLAIMYEIINKNAGEDTAVMVSNVATIIISVVAVACIVILALRKKLTRLSPNRSFLPTKSCYFNYIISIPMLLVLALMIFQTSLMISWP